MTVLDLLAAAAAPLAIGQELAVPWARIVVAFLFCIGVAVIAIAAIRARSGQGGLAMPARRNFQPGNSGVRELQLIERLALSPASQLLLVRCGTERLLILTSAAGAEVLREWDLAVEADGGA